MKRIMMVMLVAVSAAAYAQKPVKPNPNKALKALQEGKYQEAKENIDAAITHEKYKDEGKTWYYRGLIYMAIDTSSNAEVQAVAPDAFEKAVESFAEADKRADAKKEYSVKDATGLIDQTKSEQVRWWAGSHFNKAAKSYQAEDLESAVASFDKAIVINPKDTLSYLWGGYAALQAENYDRADEYLNKYIQNGGTSSDAYALLINLFTGPKKDQEKALEIVREARKKFPENGDFARSEMGILIDLNRFDEAKKSLQEGIAKDPNNKTLHFYLGYANSQINDFEAAKKNYEDALKIDPKYFEAQVFLAKLMYADALAIKKQMGQLGISAEDKKKRFELDKVLVEKLKVALPYWEKAEQLNPNDQEVLDVLYTIYGDLDMQQQLARVEKKLAELGYDK